MLAVTVGYNNPVAKLRSVFFIKSRFSTPEHAREIKFYFWGDNVRVCGTYGYQPTGRIFDCRLSIFNLWIACTRQSKIENN